MSLDQARVYLNRVLPVPPLGDPNAYMNVHWRVVKADKQFWAGRACSTVEEMIKAIVWAQSKADITDIYVCMSSQRMAEQRTSNGFTYKSAIRSQANAVHLRSLFVDVDVKAGAYPDGKTALRELYNFTKAAGLPPLTMVVLSGSGGMHAYWSLDTVLTLAEWQPLADALAEATRQHGLMTDTACTVDGARILRIPGTANFKATPPTRVQLIPQLLQGSDVPLAVMRAALAPYMTTSNVVALTPRVGAAPSVNDELSGGIERRQARPVQLDTVRETCGFIEEAYATGGKDYNNPLWHLTTLVAAFADDGRAQAHQMASGHPGYTEASTDELFDRKVREREERNLGWPSCKAVRDAGCKHCLTCPAFTLDKSPLHHAKAATLPFGAGGDLPPGYMRNERDQITVMRTLADGTAKMELVTKYPLTDAWLQRNPFVLNFSTRLAEASDKTEVSVGLSDLNGTEFSKKLGGQGMAVARTDVPKMQEFLVAWTQKLQQTKNAVISAQPFGWSVSGGKLEGFAYGGKVWGPGGASRPASLPDPVIGMQYTPCGELDPWLKAAKMITDQGRPALDAILAASFAAPLVRFTGENGVLLSAFSAESGIGKSTAIMVGQALWGHPKLGVNNLKDTANSAANKIATLQSLPLYWDELKDDESTAAFVNFAFQITQGKNKSRLAADQSQRYTGSWETVVLAASNDSLLDYAARKTKSTTAGIYRVFEFTVPPAPPTMDTGTASRITADLRENFGQAGLIYAKFLGENFQQVAQFVADTQKKLSEKLVGEQSERFWFAGMAALYAGAHYSNTLKLTEINLKALLKFMMTVLGEMRRKRKELPNDMKSALNLSMIMEQYLDARRARNTLVTDYLATRGKQTNPIKILNDVSRLDTLLVQIVRDEGLLRIKCSEFRQWLVDNGYSPNVVCDAMTYEWGMTRLPAHIMGGGTSFANGFKTNLYEIDMHGAKLQSALSAAMPAPDTSAG